MSEQTENIKTPLIQTISYVFLLAAIAAIFILTGIMKFTNAEEIVANFTKWDLLKWKDVIGAVELAGVVLLLIPKSNFIGALLLSCIMLGAIYTHLTHSEPIFFNVAIVLVIWINYSFVKPKK